MHLWLNNVPDYASAFCKVLLVFNVFSVATQILQDGIHATGNIKKMTLSMGGLNLFCLLLTYLFFFLGFDAQYAYISMVICLFIQTVINLIVLKLLVSRFPIYNYLFSIIKGCVIMLFVLIILEYISQTVSSSLLRLFMTIVLNTGLLTVVDFMIFPNYRKKILLLIKRKVNE